MDGLTDKRLVVEGEEALALASRLAALTGASVDEAVTDLLRAEVERRQRQCDIVAEARRMLAAAREIRSHIKGPVSSDTRDLYDENGFPA